MDLNIDEAVSRVGVDAAALRRALASYVRTILSGKPHTTGTYRAIRQPLRISSASD
jgi:hypothetical protein